jgi:YHS domain-containing protein/phenylpyruvate tautomerase PptA (4-oxalocrotonate tautomerase family)
MTCVLYYVQNQTIAWNFHGLSSITRQRKESAMMFIELFVPRGSLSEEQRRQIGERLVTEFMAEGEEQSAPAAVIESWRALTQVVIHEPSTWFVGGRPLDPGEPPRYVVRVSVPGAWRKDMSAEVIARITRVLAEADADPQRLYREPQAWVHVVGIAEGSCGVLGQAVGSNDIIKMITRPFRESPDREALIKAAAPGTAIDPICGMTVALSDAAITLEHAGLIYAFCSPGCRAVFTEELRVAHPE